MNAYVTVEPLGPDAFAQLWALPVYVNVLFEALTPVIAVHCAVSVLPDVYVHVNAVPAGLLVEPSFHCENVYPPAGGVQVFAAGVNDELYVALVDDGAVPEPLPQL